MRTIPLREGPPYHWLHIKTKKQGVSHFEQIQVEEEIGVGGVELIRYLGWSDKRVRQEVLFELINRWNIRGSDWKYWL